MHRYFLIPFIGFFLIISIIMIYLQFVNEDWKFLVPKIKLPDSCNNNNQVEFVIHESDINQKRSFKDEKDVYNGNQFHPIFFKIQQLFSLSQDYFMVSSINTTFNK